MVCAAMERASVRMVGRATSANFVVVKYGKNPIRFLVLHSDVVQWQECAMVYV